MTLDRFYSPGDDDASRVCRELVEPHGFTCEDHRVVTRDGFVLGLQRVTSRQFDASGADSDVNKTSGGNGRGVSRGPVLLQHGLFLGAESWVVGPPGISLPFLLARLGFEVWLGNSRCGPWSYGHTRWQPKDKEYWEWTWADMARHDLPAQIDHILAASHTGARQVFYVGHSQGTLTFLSALAAGYLPPATIAAAFLFAPVTSLAHLSSPIAHEAAKLDLDRVSPTFSSRTLVPTSQLILSYLTKRSSACIMSLPPSMPTLERFHTLSSPRCSSSILSPLLLISPLPAAPHLSSLVSSPFSSPLYVALLSPFSFSLPLSAPLSSPSLPSPPAGESNAPARVQPAQVSAARGVLRGECCEGSAARGVLQGECCKGSAACTSPRGTSPRGTSPHGTPPCATHLAARDLACPSCASPSCGHTLGELVVASACASPRINCSSLLSAFTGPNCCIDIRHFAKLVPWFPLASLVTSFQLHSSFQCTRLHCTGPNCCIDIRYFAKLVPWFPLASSVKNMAHFGQ
ncbi:unnamed protein product, partial [Closterium sp. NIES-65]